MDKNILAKPQGSQPSSGSRSAPHLYMQRMILHLFCGILSCRFL
jgi:hypothetical protein